MLLTNEKSERGTGSRPHPSAMCGRLTTPRVFGGVSFVPTGNLDVGNPGAIVPASIGALCVSFWRPQPRRRRLERETQRRTKPLARPRAGRRTTWAAAKPFLILGETLGETLGSLDFRVPAALGDKTTLPSSCAPVAPQFAAHLFTGSRIANFPTPINCVQHAHNAAASTTKTGRTPPTERSAMAAAAAGTAGDGSWREARPEDRTPDLVGRNIKVFWDDENGMCLGGQRALGKAWAGK